MQELLACLSRSSLSIRGHLAGKIYYAHPILPKTAGCGEDRVLGDLQHTTCQSRMVMSCCTTDVVTHL